MKLCVLLGSLAASTVVWAQPPTSSAIRILDANHAATGSVPTAGSQELSFEYSGSGLIGSRNDRVDLATGAFIETVHAGNLSTAAGYDGRSAWMRDVSGVNTPEEGGDRVELAVNEAYRRANLWWRSDAGGADIAYLGRETAQGIAVDHLTIFPQHGKRFDAWFDADTHFLLRIAEDQAFLHTQTYFFDYRPERGVLLAHRILIDGGAGEASCETLNLARIDVGPAHALKDYSRPVDLPTGGTIEGDAASVTLPFRFLNHHIYIKARVNGQGPYTFILDTGGHTLLSPRLVTRLGLISEGAAASSGAGSGHSTGGFAHVNEINLGGVHLRDQIAFTTTIYEQAIEGIAVDGMVGFELFSRFSVQIDYGLHTATFTDPRRFDPSGAGTGIAFKFYDHLPTIQGTVIGLPAHFAIDTGSRAELTVTEPFVAAHELEKRFPTRASVITGWGVGGPSRSNVVRLSSVGLNPVFVSAVVGDLSRDRGGSMSDPNYDGNVGSGLLQRFVVTFDYRHQMMYLRSITPVPADAGRFDRAGMWINAGPRGFIITDVASNGPADAAGLNAGDLIMSIDGTRCTAERLSDTRQFLRSHPVGSRVRLDVERNGVRREAVLTLREQV